MRVIVLPPFDREFFGGRGELEIDAANLFVLVDRLGEQAPGFAETAHMRATFAVDGVVTADWSSPLADADEVVLVPRVGGG